MEAETAHHTPQADELLAIASNPNTGIPGPIGVSCSASRTNWAALRNGPQGAPLRSLTWFLWRSRL